MDALDEPPRIAQQRLDFVAQPRSLDAIDHSMIDLGEDGSVSLPVEEGIMMLRIGWIDFYRG